MIPHERTTARAALTEILLVGGCALAVTFFLHTFVLQLFYIPSVSMGCAGCPVHTLEVNDRVAVSKLSYRLHEPRRGDIVVFDCPPRASCTTKPSTGNPAVKVLRFFGERVGVVQPSTEDYIKRIVGLPGEQVEARGGRLFVDGRRLVEPYLTEGVVTTDFGPVLVPTDEYWVMGDNRSMSSDSRLFGTIRHRSIVGRTILIIWPLPRISYL